MREKGFHSWEVGFKGEELAEMILQKTGFTIIKSKSLINEKPISLTTYHRLEWIRNPERHIAGVFAFDLYAGQGKIKWFIDVKTTQQEREHGIHLTNRQCRFGFALNTLGYNIGVLRIKLIEKKEKRVVQAKLHKIPRKFFLNLFLKDGKVDYYPSTKDEISNFQSIQP